MKITQIQTSNFLGARAVDVNLNKAIGLFAGKNGAGKSSLGEAVRMALTGETVRVSLKKEYGALLSEGAEAGFADIMTDESKYSVVLPNGKGVHSENATLPYVLDAQRFARLPENDRRAFLFGLMGVKLDGQAIKERLITRGCDAAKVEKVMPILRAGFDAASAHAAGEAKTAKGGYKTATGGDTWGKDKAAKWEPAALPPESEKAAARHDNAKAQLIEADKALAEATQELGAARAEIKRLEGLEARRMELHTKAGTIDRIKTRLDLHTAELAGWEAKVETTRAKAGGKKVDPKDPGEYLLRGLAEVTDQFLTITTEYPDVAWPSDLIKRASVHLNEYCKLHGDPTSDESKPDQEAATKLPEYEAALNLTRSTIANAKRDLEAAQQAEVEYKALVAAGDARPDVGALESKVADLTEKRNAWRADVEKYRDIADKHARRELLIKQVADLHADVLDWLDIADALAPDGIPGELLAEALGPINDRLFASSEIAQWQQVVIHSDMRITYGLRDYALISESEKWRADAMIAEAVSFLSGVKLLVLDRFDVLDLAGREDLLCWLDELAATGDIDTALIFGTLKGLPELNFGHIEAFWIENGTAGQIKAAA